jgi:hypothetical protein
VIEHDNIAGRIAEAVFPGKKVRRLTINLEVRSLPTVEAEIYVGDELRTVEGIIGNTPAWRFVDKEETLTDAEREALELAIDSLHGVEDVSDGACARADGAAGTIRKLLERLA